MSKAKPSKDLTKQSNLGIHRSAHSFQIVYNPSAIKRKISQKLLDKSTLNTKSQPYLNKRSSSVIKTKEFSSKKVTPSNSRKKLSLNENAFTKKLRQRDFRTNISLVSDVSELANRRTNTSLMNPPNDPRTSQITEAYALEQKFNQKLKNLPGTISLEEEINVYNQIFEEIIRKNKVYGPLLGKIKTVYEEKLKAYTQQKIEKYKKQTEELKQQVGNLQKDIQSSIKKLKNLSTENAELSRKLEAREEQLSYFQKKILKVSSLTGTEYPTDEYSWKLLIAENNSYVELFRNMKKELNYYKQNEKKILTVLTTLENKGYPIEEAFEANLKPASGTETNGDETDFEPLVSGPLIAAQRPQNIPELELNKLEFDSSFSYMSSDANS